MEVGRFWDRRFHSFGCLAFFKLLEVNVGHWDSYVLFDLQLSTRVHFQVRGAEETGVKAWLDKRERRWRKSHFQTHLSQWDLITLCCRLVHLHDVLCPKCLHVSLFCLYVLSACVTCTCVCVCVCVSVRRVCGLVNQSQASLWVLSPPKSFPSVWTRPSSLSLRSV